MAGEPKTSMWEMIGVELIVWVQMTGRLLWGLTLEHVAEVKGVVWRGAGLARGRLAATFVALSSAGPVFVVGVVDGVLDS